METRAKGWKIDRDGWHTRKLNKRENGLAPLYFRAKSNGLVSDVDGKIKTVLLDKNRTQGAGFVNKSRVFCRDPKASIKFDKWIANELRKQAALAKYFAKATAAMNADLDIKLTKDDDDHGIEGCATVRKRASYGAVAVKAYLKRMGNEDFDTLFRDLLTDLRHLHSHLYPKKMMIADFEELVARSDDDWASERRGEVEWRQIIKEDAKKAKAKK